MPGLLLTAEDVPTGFEETDSGEMSKQELPDGAKTGHWVNFDGPGRLYILSWGYVFKDADAAAREMAAWREREIENPPASTRISNLPEVEGLEDSVGYVREARGEDALGPVIEYQWRTGNAWLGVTLGSFDPGARGDDLRQVVSTSDLAELARIVAARAAGTT